MVKIKLKNVPSQSAQMSGNFNAILGQSGVNLKQFCDSFNKSTTFIQKDIPIFVLLSFNKKVNKIIFNFLGIRVQDLIKFYNYKNNYKGISLKDIWIIQKILFFQFEKNNISILLKKKSICKTIIATAKSMKINFIK